MGSTDRTEVEAEFRRRARRWRFAGLSTVGPDGRVRSRAVHPLWVDDTGWVMSPRRSAKVTQLTGHPWTSVAYVGDGSSTAFAECYAEVVDDPAEKRRVWELFATSPDGYDPAPWYRSDDDPGWLLIRLRPWRLQVDRTPAGTIFWQSPAAE